mmetsp:Transcript_2647/g.9245  ORF Transcript_2647/g.9245 Transcript_2647/m.9245 type:complete len:201 (+) Transcript_2647:256-858(+)
MVCNTDAPAASTGNVTASAGAPPPDAVPALTSAAVGAVAPVSTATAYATNGGLAAWMLTPSEVECLWSTFGMPPSHVTAVNCRAPARSAPGRGGWLSTADASLMRSAPATAPTADPSTTITSTNGIANPRLTASDAWRPPRRRLRVPIPIAAQSPCRHETPGATIATWSAPKLAPRPPNPAPSAPAKGLHEHPRRILASW